MNILQLVESLDRGGLERMVTGLIGGLQQQGHRLAVGYLSHPGVFADGLREVACWQYTEDLSKKRYSLRAQLDLNRFIKDQQIDLIHSHNPLALRYGLPAGILTRTHHIHTVHGRGAADDSPWAIKALLRRYGARMNVGMVAVSNDIEQRLCRIDRVDHRCITVIYNGVDADEWVPAGAKRNNELLIGSVGRLVPEKNYPLLIEAASATFAADETADRRPQTVDLGEGGSGDFGERTSNIEHRTSNAELGEGESGKWRVEPRRSRGKGGGWDKEEREAQSPTTLHPPHFTQTSSSGPTLHAPRSTLLLVGDGPERTHLEDKARAPGIADQVTFAGMQADPRPFYAQMDVFCLSSDTEGLPMTLLEAGACGLPCVVTDAGGCGEVVQDGVTGFVVPRGDAAAFAAALAKLAADPELRRRMGKAARERVEREFSLERMTSAYLKVYGAVARGQAPHSAG